ncbi:LANO_0F13740g1_1 [Lachancea nothofagi CBS 11611]|uniref:Nucleoporin NUP188 n=1 Tax=Lachancea nothofagi CBS 11611 TaxID=1266666 RepID=A0A1G4KBZ7_9SACH|nr:LANO_0F13740g1_1 [Lachancea nothofagi CBS 11611]
MDISHLSFGSVCEFIKSSEGSSNSSLEVQDLISQFLRDYRQLLLNPGLYNNPGAEVASKHEPLKIGSISYEISGEIWKDASQLCRFLGVSHHHGLRVVAQTHFRSGLKKDRLFLYAQRILQERNEVVETLLAILTSDYETFAASRELIKAIATDRTTVCLHLIEIISKVAKDSASLNKSDALWSQELQDYKSCQDVIYAGKILRLLPIIIINSDTPVGVITSWFTVLKDTKFFSCFSPSGASREVSDQIEALATVNTVLMLGLDVTSFSINTDASYFEDVECFKAINSTLLDQPGSALILYYWSFVLSLKSYLLEESPESNAQFVQEVFGSTPITQITSYLVKYAEDLDVLGSFLRFSHCVEHDELWSSVLSSLLGLSLNFVTMTKQTAKTIKEILVKAPKAFVEKFLTNPEVEKKVSLIRTKVPLVTEGLIPLIYFTTIHPEFANFEWKDLNTYTEKLRLSNISYDMAETDGTFSVSSDFIVLKEELLVRPPFECQENVLMPIPKGTYGKIIPISSTAEDAVVFMHTYNGWSLLGRIVQSLCESYTQSEEDQIKKGKSELAVAIIDLIGNTVGPESPIERSIEVLQHLSGYVENGDIVSVLFKLFELALHARDLEVVNAGLGLMIELISNFPHFVWSHLARSNLIDRNGKEGLAASILANMGRTSGDFKSSILLIRLTNCLISESISIEESFPERMKKEIIGKLMTYMIRIYEGFQFQNYSNHQQRLEIGLLLTSLITKILYAVYGIDPSSLPQKKVTSVLSNAAELAIGAFLSTSALDNRAVDSLIAILTSTNGDTFVRKSLPFTELYFQLVKQSFELSYLLISVRSLLNLPPSAFERSIFTKSASFVKSYASTLDQRTQIIKLFTHLVRAPWDMEAPSLLSYMGNNNSKLLLSCVAYDLKGPLTNQTLAKSLYSFFSAIMESKQDGLAVLFLTGKLVSLNDKEEVESDSTAVSHSILTILKNNALKLDKLPESVSSHLLDAIAYAFNTWTAARGYENDTEFINILVKRLETFQPQTTSEKVTAEQFIEFSNQYKVVSRIAEILALSLFTSTADNNVLLKVLNKPDLASSVKKIFQIDGYDEKLQSSLQSKFRSLWPNIQLSMFTSSPLLRLSRSFHTSIFDIPLMDQYFEQDEKWIGTDSVTGFRHTVVAASINLQFVNYQIAAAKSWGALLTSFIRKSPVPLNDTYLDIAAYLLASDSKAATNGSIFKDIYLARIELAFYILYSFLQTKKTIPDKKLMNLLLSTMDMVKSKEVGFLDSISQPSKLSYYRPLIRIVLIICSLVNNGKIFVESVADHLLEYFELTFGKGVNSILSTLLSEINSSVSHRKRPVLVNLADKIQDLLLLLSSFTKIKSLQPPNDFQMILASSLNEVGTIKTILNVYSSSHLLNFEEEPVLCDLSLTFLTELCSVEYVAEKLITNGLFSVVLESPVSVAIQQGKIMPHTQPKLHTLWSDGLLTIILQLLSKFGKKILPECCLFVSYFSEQIKSAISQWSDPSLAVSIAAIKETSQLIMLQRILNALDYQDYLTESNIQTKIIDKTEIIELFYGLDTFAERKELSYAFKHLLTHPKFLNSRIVSTTLEEQRLMDNEETRANFVKRVISGIKNLDGSLFSDIA